MKYCLCTLEYHCIVKTVKFYAETAAQFMQSGELIVNEVNQLPKEKQYMFILNCKSKNF